MCKEIKISRSGNLDEGFEVVGEPIELLNGDVILRKVSYRYKNNMTNLFNKGKGDEDDN